MTDYIERKVIQAALQRKKVSPAKIRYTEGWNDCMMRVKSMVSHFPVADVAPVVHGKWIYEDIVQCSECGFGTFMDGYFFDHGECTHADDRSFRFSFCPNCGAKMDEKD